MKVQSQYAQMIFILLELPHLKNLRCPSKSLLGKWVIASRLNS